MYSGIHYWWGGIFVLCTITLWPNSPMCNRSFASIETKMTTSTSDGVQRWEWWWHSNVKHTSRIAFNFFFSSSSSLDHFTFCEQIYSIWYHQNKTLATLLPFLNENIICVRARATFGTCVACNNDADDGPVKLYIFSFVFGSSILFLFFFDFVVLIGKNTNNNNEGNFICMAQMTSKILCIFGHSLSCSTSMYDDRQRCSERRYSLLLVTGNFVYIT